MRKKGKGPAHKIKRPAIMRDLDFALLCMVGKSLNAGDAVTKSSIKKWGLSVFLGLHALLMYDYGGERIRPLSDMSEEHVNMFLDSANYKCPLCQADIGGNHACIYNHLLFRHPDEAANIVGSPPGGSTPGGSTPGIPFFRVHSVR